MHLQERIQLMVEMGRYMASDDPAWMEARRRAGDENGWFTPEYIALAVSNITEQFLNEKKLTAWAEKYSIPQHLPSPKQIGLIMAGNIPLVGFHDFLSIFISGHDQVIKPASKDRVLISHLIGFMHSKNDRSTQVVQESEMMKGCDAYITTGSNNSARYFDYYFSRFPHIIRRNRTSVAILDGSETTAELGSLAEDIFQFFGLGCRNVTKIFVPQGYDFAGLLNEFKKFDSLADYSKYKNNYDYQLTLLILNKQLYMSTEALLLAQNESLFSPISVLHYEYYSGDARVLTSGLPEESIQCLVGHGFLPFGKAQQPTLADYADGIDTLEFLTGL